MECPPDREQGSGLQPGQLHRIAGRIASCRQWCRDPEDGYPGCASANGRGERQTRRDHRRPALDPGEPSRPLRTIEPFRVDGLGADHQDAGTGARERGDLVRDEAAPAGHVMRWIPARNDEDSEGHAGHYRRAAAAARPVLPFGAMSTASPAPPVARTTAVRPGPVGLIRVAWSDVWSRRKLIRYLVAADLKKKGRDTLFGNVWWILDPLLQMVVYVVLVSIIFGRAEDDYALFIFAAILPWKWFSSAIGDTITSVSGQDRLIKQVQFPKIVLPVAAILAGITQFAFGMVPLAALMLLVFPDRISATLVLIPVVAAVQLVFTLALGVLAAALNVFFRDIGNLSRHALRLWFYLSPALYGAAVINDVARTHPQIATLITINPFYPILNAYRSVIYEGTTPDWIALGGVLSVSLAFLLVATWFFKRVEPTFAKVL
ncbi:MAG: Transport permease protein [Chloroflexi bacterium]|nr:Transport permease protein [Chloroflexota bacterium]